MSRGQRRHANQARGQGLSTRAILLTLAAVIVLVGGGLAIYALTSGGGSSSKSVAGIEEVDGALTGVTVKGDTLGDPQAPVLITEFADLRCPICKAYAQSEALTVIDQLVRTGKARLRLRIWPILGADSVSAGKAAYAAQKQGTLWRFALLWYENQKDEKETYATPAFYDPIAKAAGADVQTFTRDRTSSAATGWLQATSTEATVEKFTGTPSFMVEGPKGKTAIVDRVPNAAGLAQLVKQAT